MVLQREIIMENTSQKKLNGQQKSLQDIDAFKNWMSEKTDEEYATMIHQGKLSRTIISDECGIARAQPSKNRIIKGLLSELESDLRSRGVLPKLAESKKEPQKKSSLDRNMIKDVKAESRVSFLEQRVLELEAELASEKERSGRFSELSQAHQDLAEM